MGMTKCQGIYVERNKPIFTVDWENWNRGLFIGGYTRIEEPTIYLLNLLRKHKIKAIFYMLGMDVQQNYSLYKKIIADGHIEGDHGYYHYHDEGPHMADNLYPHRSPFWDKTPMPWPPSGGFFFRVMPFWYVKWAVLKSGMGWIHPHDLDEGHPRIKNPWLNWKRHVGLKTARKKLERLLQEVQFADPSKN